MLPRMRFSSAISTADDLESAVRQATRTAREKLHDDAGPVAGAAADLAIVFVATGYPHKERLPQWLRDECPVRHLIGCSGGGIVGGGVEVETQPAVAVMLARLPRTSLTVQHLSNGDLPSPDAPPADWRKRILGTPNATSPAGLIVLPEPFSFDADRLIRGLDYALPSVPVVGGMASGSNHPGGHVLYEGVTTHQTGALILALDGPVRFETRVAQGCRPFGKVGVITRCRDNLLVTINKQPALAYLRDSVDLLPEADRALVENGAPIFLGIGMDPFAAEPPAAGDFLVRNLLGADEANDVLSVGAELSTGRHVQFHLRDRQSSADDLRAVLGRKPSAAVAGALMFACLGRGQHLYGVEGHDSHVFKTLLGDTPLSGFFCNGEIGPLGGSTHMHGYTSSFALIGGVPQ